MKILYVKIEILKITVELIEFNVYKNLLSEINYARPVIFS